MVLKHFMQFTMTRTQEYIEKMEGNQEIRLKKAVDRHGRSLVCHTEESGYY